MWVNSQLGQPWARNRLSRVRSHRIMLHHCMYYNYKNISVLATQNVSCKNSWPSFLNKNSWRSFWEQTRGKIARRKARDIELKVQLKTIFVITVHRYPVRYRTSTLYGNVLNSCKKMNASTWIDGWQLAVSSDDHDLLNFLSRGAMTKMYNQV